MKNESEHQKFKKQFTPRQWARLEQNLEFMEAWAADDLIKAGEIANRLEYGEVLKKKDGKEIRQLKEQLAEFDWDD